MKIIQAPSIGRLHELAVIHVRDNGVELTTEDGEHTLETEPLTLVCKTPFDAYRISAYSHIRTNMMNEYAKALVDGYIDGTHFTYDYHTRLFAYPNLDLRTNYEVNTNQILAMAEKLKAHKETRRAVATTWIPGTDNFLKDVPCLQYIQCKLRNDTLDMLALFRSNDILLAAGANMYALTELQKRIAENIGVQTGTYTHVAVIPHIYDYRDADVLSKYP